ncbi:putative quinol monooxygenase [Poritiphilus flavus]|uniref:ABM domain-containing protein n=1 Tax=Poritiphilus flavus TaxID=2697053 RepID=A0A6L9E8M6_9FLAO|nr:antibiotic biosynthesis monooxygenase [Poritiphilus flavus]NAS10948.1 hypothetical protein [Poritiphilus flavus]
MVHILIPYEVRAEEVENAKSIITAFVKAIQENEPETLFYKSFQLLEDPTRFVHVMIFKNEEARERHSSSAYCREFAHKLYAMCKERPEPQFYAEVH